MWQVQDEWGLPPYPSDSLIPTNNGAQKDLLLYTTRFRLKMSLEDTDFFEPPAFRYSRRREIHETCTVYPSPFIDGRRKIKTFLWWVDFV
jgi:hypothetical protein